MEGFLMDGYLGIIVVERGCITGSGTDMSFVARFIVMLMFFLLASSVCCNLLPQI